MRDFLPEDVRRREYVIALVKRVYERYGFEPIETPALENLETLVGNYGEEGAKLIFKVLKRGVHESTGQADLALRYDLTVPLARVIAQHHSKLGRLFKRYQIQPVWRADRPAHGRFREFYQCDVDSMGSTSPLVETELCSAVSDVLGELQFNDYVIRLNHRKVLYALLKNTLIPSQQHEDVLVSLDKLDKIGAQGVAKELTDKGVAADNLNRLMNWIGAEWKADWLDWLEAQFALLDDEGRAGFENLRQILRLAAETRAAERIRFHPSLARGLSYYTGAIMEVALEHPDSAGSLGGGGRYDNLVGKFSKESIPACGFSLGLERILVVMEEREMFQSDLGSGAADVMVTFSTRGAEARALKLASELRAEGFRVFLYPDADKSDKQNKYAFMRGIRFVAQLSDSDQDIVRLKELKDRALQKTAVCTWLSLPHVIHAELKHG